ncbi:MAG: methylmalonyl Co-A mutase-associated GTPase MeaB [Chloroflexota bacterium]
MSDLVEQLDAGNPRALPRLLSLVERRDPAGLAALAELYPRSGKALVVGITGPPGAGKSTLVSAIAKAGRASGMRVAILAIDPSSPISGGAVLGDRIRMMDLHDDPGVFIRSVASKGRTGGLAPTAAAMVHCLDAAGFPLILLETVGAGQDSIDIDVLARTVVVVQAPGFGDGVQAIKAGILEIGDILVVNKSDLPGAQEVSRMLRGSIDHAEPGGWEVPVLLTNAATGEGVAELLEAINAHGAWMVESGQLGDRLTTAARAEVLDGLRDELERRLTAATAHALNGVIADVAARRMTPELAVETMLAALPGLGGASGDQGGS